VEIESPTRGMVSALSRLSQRGRATLKPTRRVHERTIPSSSRTDHFIAGTHNTQHGGICALSSAHGTLAITTGRQYVDMPHDGDDDDDRSRSLPLFLPAISSHSSYWPVMILNLALLTAVLGLEWESGFCLRFVARGRPRLTGSDGFSASSSSVSASSYIYIETRHQSSTMISTDMEAR
jgi:hypothetical protein